MEQVILGAPIFEWIGYLASAGVLLSFLMKKLQTLRVVNTVGCFLFVVYGLVLPEISWPIIVTNVAIIGINAFYLIKATNANT